MYDDDILDSWNFIIVLNTFENNRKCMLNLDYNVMYLKYQWEIKHPEIDLRANSWTPTQLRK